MSILRCNECGSWGSECASAVPIADCCCARCATSRSLRQAGKIIELRSRLAAAEAEQDRLDDLRETVRESLPRYVLDDGEDDGCGNEANEIETVEYAGAEIKRLTSALREIADMTDGWENGVDPTIVRHIDERARAALGGQP